MGFRTTLWYEYHGFPLGRLPSAGDVFPGFFLIWETNAGTLRSIAESPHLAIEYTPSKDAAIYRSAQPSEYRLSQAADYICTMELTAI